jgi:hypothetical protein
MFVIHHYLFQSRPGPPGWGFGVGLTTLPCKKKIVEKPPRNSAGFCGGGLSQGKKKKKLRELGLPV